MPPESEILCPFCQARRPLMGTRSQPFPFGRSGDLPLYQCPCGALGFISATIDGSSWDVHNAKNVICRLILQAEPADCDVDMNSATLIDPPTSILWVKRRASPGA